MSNETDPATYISVGAELDKRNEEAKRMGIEVKMLLLNYASGVITEPQSFRLINGAPEYGTYKGMLLREGGIVSREWVNGQIQERKKQEMVVLLSDGIYKIPWKDTGGFPEIVPDYNLKKEIEPQEYLEYGYNAMDAIRLVSLRTNNTATQQIP